MHDPTGGTPAAAHELDTQGKCPMLLQETGNLPAPRLKSALGRLTGGPPGTRRSSHIAALDHHAISPASRGNVTDCPRGARRP